MSFHFLNAYEFFELKLFKFLTLACVCFVGETGCEMFLPLGCVRLHFRVFVFFFLVAQVGMSKLPLKM